MDPEGSLSCSQKPMTGAYPEADESIPHLSTLFLQNPYYPHISA
jgi:hypothetical protein